MIISYCVVADTPAEVAETLQRLLSQHDGKPQAAHIVSAPAAAAGPVSDVDLRAAVLAAVARNRVATVAAIESFGVQRASELAVTDRPALLIALESVK